MSLKTYRINQTKSSGFTLMELLIAIGIVAILAAIAIPTYIHYTKKAYYSEVVLTANKYKAAVADCAAANDGVLTSCDGGAQGIPANITAGAGSGSQVASAIVTDGVITVTPRVDHGIAATDTYILAPTYSSTAQAVTWVATGGGCTTGLVSC